MRKGTRVPERGGQQAGRVGVCGGGGEMKGGYLPTYSCAHERRGEARAQNESQSSKSSEG